MFIDTNATFSFLLLTIKIQIMSFDLEFLELVIKLQWLLEIRTYNNKNGKQIKASSCISLEPQC